MNLIAKKVFLSLIALMLATIAFSQVSLTTIPATSLASTLRSNTSFVDSVYNEWNGKFQNTFTAGGLQWTRVKNNPVSFDLNEPLSVSVIDINYTEAMPYSIGVKSGTQTTTLWNNLNNTSVFPINTTMLSSTTANTYVSFFSLFQGNTQNYQNERDGWAFYNVAGTDTFLGFAEVGLRSGVDFNDGVCLFQTAVPEPETYVMLLGALTLGFVVYRRRYHNA